MLRLSLALLLAYLGHTRDARRELSVALATGSDDSIELAANYVSHASRLREAWVEVPYHVSALRPLRPLASRAEALAQWTSFHRLRG
jgi:hypothetical protein